MREDDINILAYFSEFRVIKKDWVGQRRMNYAL